MSDSKIKTYEFFTPAYSVIIQAKSTLAAIEEYSKKYQDKVIMILDTEYFKLLNKIVELEIK